MKTKALDNLLITYSLKKGTIFGIDSLKIAAKVRLFWESTKEKDKILRFSYIRLYSTKSQVNRVPFSIFRFTFFPNNSGRYLG